jgi:hypothetical protein
MASFIINFVAVFASRSSIALITCRLEKVTCYGRLHLSSSIIPKLA